MHRHAVDGGQAIVVGKVKNNDMDEERSVGGLNFIFRSVVDGDTVLPVFKLLVQLANGVEQFAVRLLRSLGGIQPFVNSALDGRELAQRPEKIELSSTVGERHVSNVVWRVFAWKFDIHVVVVLYWWPSGSQANTL